MSGHRNFAQQIGCACCILFIEVVCARQRALGKETLRFARDPTRPLGKFTRWLRLFAQSNARDQAGQIRSASRAPALVTSQPF